MASATKRGPSRWLGRYRDPAGKERTKTHTTKGDALRWAQEQERRMRSMDWTDPQRAKVTVGEWSEQWRATLSVKPKTAASYDSLLRTCVLPRWGSVRLDQITTAQVRTWVAAMTGGRAHPLSASRVRQAHGVLSAILDLAVEDGRIPRNLAKSTTGGRGFLPPLPRQSRHRYLTHAELARLADAAKPYDGLILVLGYCGLRWGEASALRVRDADLLRGRLHVSRSLVEIGGQVTFGTPKSHAARTVQVPAFLRARLACQMGGKGHDDLLFAAPNGGPLRSSNFRARLFDPAMRASGIARLTPHDLRHTAASLAIAAGANVKAVQRMLGHASASMTLDVYAGLFDDDLDTVAKRLDEAASEALADSVRTEPVIRSLTSVSAGGQYAL